MILETVADALLEALECGARLPNEFTVRLPWEAMGGAVFQGSPLRIAGHVLHVVPDGFSNPLLVPQ